MLLPGFSQCKMVSSSKSHLNSSSFISLNLMVIFHPISLALRFPYKAQSHLSFLRSIKKCSFFQWTRDIQQRNISGCVLHPKNTKPEKNHLKPSQHLLFAWRFKRILKKIRYFSHKDSFHSLTCRSPLSSSGVPTPIFLKETSRTWYWTFHFHTKSRFPGLLRAVKPHNSEPMPFTGWFAILLLKRNNSEEKRFLQCELQAEGNGCDETVTNVQTHYPWFSYNQHQRTGAAQIRLKKATFSDSKKL